MNRFSMRLVSVGLFAVAIVGISPAVHAQCCSPMQQVTYRPIQQVAYQPVQQVAYQPVQQVVYQPTVAYQPRRGWYPGKLLDKWRLRRYGVSTAAAPAYTAGYSPYTAGYAPYTAAYSPYTAGYSPYVTSYAPLSRTSYYPVATTAARPVLLRPTVAMSPVIASCCSPCSSCGTGVNQAAYGQPASPCPSCAGAASTPIYSNSPSVGQTTPQPQLQPNEPTPAGSSTYESNRPTTEAPATQNDKSTYFEAPKLFNPRDRTASRTSVDVIPAVYTQPTTTREAGYPPTTDSAADGWYSVPSDR